MSEDKRRGRSEGSGLFVNFYETSNLLATYQMSREVNLNV